MKLKMILLILFAGNRLAFAAASPEEKGTKLGSDEAIISQELTQKSKTNEKAQEGQEAKQDVTPSAKADEKSLKEDQIPLQLEQKKTAGGESSAWFRILFSFSLVGLLGTGAYFFLRKYAKPKDQLTATKIKVISQHWLGPKKSLAIVHVAGESVLIGITDQNISMIKSLSLIDDEIPEEIPKTFSSALIKSEKTDIKKEDVDASEEFSFGGIKDVVSKKLKGMRSLDL